MKSVMKAICALFVVGVIALGVVFATNGGVTYEFEVVENIDSYAQGESAVMLGEVYKNDSEQTENKTFEGLTYTGTYKSNEDLLQAEYRLIEETTGINFSKSYSKQAIENVTGDVAANEYAYVNFTPQVGKISGYLVQKSGEGETREYIEIVYPIAEDGKVVGETELVTSMEKPAEKLS